MAEDPDLDTIRLHTLADHLATGDGWALVQVDDEDLNLPPSSRELRDLSIHYAGGLEETGRSAHADGTLAVEYKFDADAEVTVVLDAPEAVALGWEGHDLSGGLALARGTLKMTGWLGALFEGPEDLGRIEYIGIQRSDGTRGAPTPGYNDGQAAVVLDLDLMRRKDRRDN